MPLQPPAIVTCGPAYAPIDSVRRISNFSTGELGTLLCEALSDANVICLRGEMASFRPPRHGRVIPFSTNASLLEAFKNLPQPEAIFHAAALCDYEVSGMPDGTQPAKIRSDSPQLTLTLKPAAKVLPELRRLFPHALIVGWKYELDGSREDAVERAQLQIDRAGNDACVVNGAAYGDGLGLVEPGSPLRHFASKKELCDFLPGWMKEKTSHRRQGG